MLKRCILVFCLACVVVVGSFAQKPTRQWLDQKFSMFIHFGLYSVYGGMYDGKPIERGYSEQIQSFAGIFSDWYANTAHAFNPVKWNADSVVALAKAAGMKSIVITSKHHDGFCMYHSRHTDFNIVDATPYGRDLMKELADACTRGGIGFGVYFSLIDWHFPQAYPISSHNADPLTPEHYAFNLKQVEEIMTNYGDISEIWFDMGSLTPEQSHGLYELVHRLQPQCMISGRLGNDFVDFAVMADNEYPDYKLGVPWQTAASMFDETWGYRSWQKRGEVSPKVNEKITSLIKVISRGGNYLLNIGPRGDGSVVEFEADVLHNMGQWIKSNAEAIYATQSNPFAHPFEWGEITTKDNNLYLFVKKEFEGKDILLNGFSGAISEVNVLSSREKCIFNRHKIYNGGYYIHVPTSVNNTPYNVLKVSFKNGFFVLPTHVVGKNKALTAHNATPVFGYSALNYYAGYKTLIGYDWTFECSRSTVAPKIYFTENEKGREIEIIVDGNSKTVVLDNAFKQTVCKANSGIKWGNIYQKSGNIVFGILEEENKRSIDVHARNSKWKKVVDFPYGEKQQVPLLPRKNILFLQEIESDRAQDVAIEIGSGNALYLLLNGEYITAHFSSERVKYEKQIVILPLKKGMNQLVLKLYNGYEKTLNYSIKPLDRWNIYMQQLDKIPLSRQKKHTFSIRTANPESKVLPLRMNNVKMKNEE